MSITPTITESGRERDQPDSVGYTVVGGGRFNRHAAQRVSVLLLHRLARFNRAAALAELQRLGLEEVVSVETGAQTQEIESLTRSFPSARFVLLGHKLGQQLSYGEQINIGMAEARSSHVFVLWDDALPRTVSAAAIRQIIETDMLCVTPLLRDHRNMLVPSLFAPAYNLKQLKVVPQAVQYDGMPTLYPYDYIGIYARRPFLSCGGYDSEISGAHWQRLDFGFRVYTWGWGIAATTAIAVHEQAAREPDDTTPTDGYRRFHLKNLAPIFMGDHCRLSLRRFPGFALRSGDGLIDSWRLFRDTQHWVYRNRFRFVQDARQVAELWGERQ